MDARADWISPWWQACCLPEWWSVCGVRVPSLSVWHVFALENIGNRYICGGEVDKNDAASLLLFASRDMRKGKRLMHSPFHQARAVVRMHAKLRKVTPSECVTACTEYTRECMRHGTRMNSQGGGGTPAGAPEPWAIVCTLMRTGMTFAKAWNTPYAVGRSIMDAQDERQGNAVMTPWHYGEYMHDNWDEFKNQTGTREVDLAAWQPSHN